MQLEKLKSITGHVAAIYDVTSKDSLFAYTTSADKHVARWDLKSGIQDDFAVKLELSGFRIALNQNKQLLAIGNSKGGIHVVDLDAKIEKRMLNQHKSAIFSLVYDEINNVFYSGDAEGYFCVWNGDSFDLLLTLPLSCGKIRQIAINESAAHIAICGQDGNVRILETNFYNEITTLKAHRLGANCAVFDQDKLYTGGKDAHIAIWDWKSNLKLKSIPAHNYAVYDLMLFNKNKHLVSVSFDKSIKLWNSEDISIIERVEFKDGGHRHVVNRIAKLDDLSFLTVSDDKQIIQWKLSE
jgi:WD40 repeat protein